MQVDENDQISEQVESNDSVDSDHLENLTEESTIKSPEITTFADPKFSKTLNQSTSGPGTGTWPCEKGDLLLASLQVFTEQQTQTNHLLAIQMSKSERFHQSIVSRLDNIATVITQNGTQNDGGYVTENNPRSCPPATPATTPRGGCLSVSRLAPYLGPSLRYIYFIIYVGFG